MKIKVLYFLAGVIFVCCLAGNYGMPKYRCQYCLFGTDSDDIWQKHIKSEAHIKNTPEYEEKMAIEREALIQAKAAKKLLEILPERDIKKLIPLWPDYIKLDKDLVFDEESKKVFHVLPKGTKIYYK